jgi:hypothetical protein
VKLVICRETSIADRFAADFYPQITLGLLFAFVSRGLVVLEVNRCCVIKGEQRRLEVAPGLQDFVTQMTSLDIDVVFLAEGIEGRIIERLGYDVRYSRDFRNLNLITGSEHFDHEAEHNRGSNIVFVTNTSNGRWAVHDESFGYQVRSVVLCHGVPVEKKDRVKAFANLMKAEKGLRTFRRLGAVVGKWFGAEFVGSSYTDEQLELLDDADYEILEQAAAGWGVEPAAKGGLTLIPNDIIDPASTSI